MELPEKSSKKINMLINSILFVNAMDLAVNKTLVGREAEIIEFAKLYNHLYSHIEYDFTFYIHSVNILWADDYIIPNF